MTAGICPACGEPYWTGLPCAKATTKKVGYWTVYEPLPYSMRPDVIAARADDMRFMPVEARQAHDERKKRGRK